MQRLVTKSLSIVLTGVIAAGLLSSMPVLADDNTERKNIVEVAVDAGQFTTLAAALEAADLIDTLQGDGPFTVFAPTDDAFAALPAGTVESLLKPENRDQLVAVLTYHVVPGKVSAADVVTLDEAKTVNGASINISTENGSVYINDATVVAADVDASNGVIHVIDTVILPN
ncbi:MAG: fasciclin domain-containing protein [Pseudomonadota bacterium]